MLPEKILPEEIIKKVRLIEFSTKKVVNQILCGQYKSFFKGQGVQFSEHRQYVPGDDVRHINWNASARSKEPLLKKFDEERELTVFLIVDVSGSQNFGTQKTFKNEMAAILAGMLATAASYTNDKIGLLLFASDVEHVVPPQKGKAHVMRLVRDILSFTPKTTGTDLQKALHTADCVMKHNGVLFILSDFMTEGYQLTLSKLAQKHDIVAIALQDPTEAAFPSLGLVSLVNPETQAEVCTDSSTPAFQKWFDQNQKAHEKTVQKLSQTGKIDLLTVQTKDNYADALVHFFRNRLLKR
jgi:uncharacterized protein (DUF58 family)